MYLPDSDDHDRFGKPIGDRVLRRGIDTSVGQAGYCDACDTFMPDGPDACLGYMDHVSFACCGHGGVCTPYVAFGEKPNTSWDGPKHALYGEDALEYFEKYRGLI